MSVNLNDISSYSNAFNSKALLLLGDKKQTEFWIKTVSIPEISMESTQEPEYPNTTLAIEGDVVTYGDLPVTIFVDEHFNVYQELYNWFFKSLPGKDNVRPQVPATIMIFNNQFTKTVAKFKFKNMFLSALPSIEYDNYSSTVITLSLTFKYDYYEPVFEN